MIWIALCIILLTLYSLFCRADWIGMFTITSATISCNSILLYCIFMLYCRIPHCQNGIQLFFNNHRQNITNSSTSSYIRTGVSSPSTRNSPSLEDFLRAWRILINTKYCDVRVVHALANHKSQFCLYWEWRKVYIIFWFGLLVCIIFLQWQDPVWNSSFITIQWYCLLF